MQVYRKNVGFLDNFAKLSFRNYTISKTFPKVEVLNFLIQERKYRVHTNEVEVVHLEKISKKVTMKDFDNLVDFVFKESNPKTRFYFKILVLLCVK